MKIRVGNMGQTLLACGVMVWMGLVSAASAEVLISDNFNYTGADVALTAENGANMDVGRQSGTLANIDWATPKGGTYINGLGQMRFDGSVTEPSYLDHSFKDDAIRRGGGYVVQFDVKGFVAGSQDWIALAVGIESDEAAGAYHYADATGTDWGIMLRGGNGSFDKWVNGSNWGGQTGQWAVDADPTDDTYTFRFTFTGASFAEGAAWVAEGQVSVNGGAFSDLNLGWNQGSDLTSEFVIEANDAGTPEISNYISLETVDPYLVDNFSITALDPPEPPEGIEIISDDFTTDSTGINDDLADRQSGSLATTAWVDAEGAGTISADGKLALATVAGNTDGVHLNQNFIGSSVIPGGGFILQFDLNHKTSGAGQWNTISMGCDPVSATSTEYFGLNPADGRATVFTYTIRKQGYLNLGSNGGGVVGNGLARVSCLRESVARK